MNFASLRLDRFLLKGDAMNEGGRKLCGMVNSDCLDVMKRMSSNSVDAIVTDPPYGISFMSKGFDTFKKEGMSDNQAFQADMTPLFKEMLRVAKPGAHLLAFGGTRTYHRLTCAIEDAGWEIRDCLGWIYSSGMPKSMDISKAIDKRLGAQRETGMTPDSDACYPREDLIPITEDAKKWHGWGTCLKPAFEPIVLARKPVEGTVVDNVLKWGVAGLNIDDCRVESDKPVVIHSPKKETLYDSGHKDLGTWVDNRGRFPANLIHDGSDEALGVFPDNGTARFFYCPKASKKEKGPGNQHPTVKPIALMKYLVKLVAPKGALVLDPFMGSGTTGVAAVEVGCRFLGIEKDSEYFKIAENRIGNAIPKTTSVV